MQPQDLLQQPDEERDTPRVGAYLYGPTWRGAHLAGAFMGWSDGAAALADGGPLTLEHVDALRAWFLDTQAYETALWNEATGYKPRTAADLNSRTPGSAFLGSMEPNRL